jgi:hypothetical protein
LISANYPGRIDKEADMNEDFSTKAWADNHATLSDGIARAIRATTDSLRVLNAKQFDAPWRQPAQKQDCPSR